MGYTFCLVRPRLQNRHDGQGRLYNGSKFHKTLLALFLLPTCYGLGENVRGFEKFYRIWKTILTPRIQMVQVGGSCQRCLHHGHHDIVPFYRHLLLHPCEELLDHRRTRRRLHGRRGHDSHMRNHELCRGFSHHGNTNTLGSGRKLIRIHFHVRTATDDS